jgi:cell division transport system permease protein
VGVTTLIIISHIIRLGIDNNREQIKTLILLGAPDSFIAWPFVLAGLLLSVGGAVLASALSAYALSYIYGRVASPLPFIPLPPLNTLILNIVLVIICLGAVLGLAGSVIGLRTAASSN